MGGGDRGTKEGGSGRGGGGGVIEGEVELRGRGRGRGERQRGDERQDAPPARAGSPGRHRGGGSDAGRAGPRERTRRGATTRTTRRGSRGSDGRVARVAGRSAPPHRPRRGGRTRARGRWDELAVPSTRADYPRLPRFPPDDARRRPARGSRRRPRARDATTDATPGGQATASTVAIRRARRGVCPRRARLDPRPDR